MNKLIIIPVIKLIKVFKLEHLLSVIFNKWVPKIISKGLGMPNLSEKYVKTINGSLNKYKKTKTVMTSLKNKISKKPKNKDNTTNTKEENSDNVSIKKDSKINIFDKEEQNQEVVEDNKNSVVGVVKHIVNNVSENISLGNNSDNKEKKLLKIKDGKSNSAPVSEDEEELKK